MTGMYLPSYLHLMQTVILSLSPNESLIVLLEENDASHFRTLHLLSPH